MSYKNVLKVAGRDHGEYSDLPRGYACRARTNLYGGGISLGHPPGATGARMTITALQHLEESGGRRAVVFLCMGAGQGMALLFERAG